MSCTQSVLYIRKTLSLLGIQGVQSFNQNRYNKNPMVGLKYNFSPCMDVEWDTMGSAWEKICVWNDDIGMEALDFCRKGLNGRVLFAIADDDATLERYGWEKGSRRIYVTDLVDVQKGDIVGIVLVGPLFPEKRPQFAIDRVWQIEYLCGLGGVGQRLVKELIFQLVFHFECRAIVLGSIKGAEKWWKKMGWGNWVMQTRTGRIVSADPKTADMMVSTRPVNLDLLDVAFGHDDVGLLPMGYAVDPQYLSAVGQLKKNYYTLVLPLKKEVTMLKGVRAVYRNAIAESQHGLDRIHHKSTVSLKRVHPYKRTYDKFSVIPNQVDTLIQDVTLFRERIDDINESIDQKRNTIRSWRLCHTFLSDSDTTLQPLVV